MQIWTKTAAGPDTYALLLDEAAGDALERDTGTARGAVQSDNLAFSSTRYRTARGNIERTLPLRWSKNYNTAAAALDGIKTVSDLKLVKLHLKIIEGATVLYLPNAISETHHYERNGREVIHELNFASDDFTNIEP